MAGAWYGTDRPHLPSAFVSGHPRGQRKKRVPPTGMGTLTKPPGEQARLVKTVKVQLALAGAAGSDRRLHQCYTGLHQQWCSGVAIDWVTGRSSEEQCGTSQEDPCCTPGLNVQSGHGKWVM